MLLPCRACTQVHIQFIFQNSNKPHHSTSFLPDFSSSTLHFTHLFPRLQKTIRPKRPSIFSPRTASRVNCKTRWKLLANCRSGTWKTDVFGAGSKPVCFLLAFFLANSPIIEVSKLQKLPGYLFCFEVWCLEWEFFSYTIFLVRPNDDGPPHRSGDDPHIQEIALSSIEALVEEIKYTPQKKE